MLVTSRKGTSGKDAPLIGDRPFLIRSCIDQAASVAMDKMKHGATCLCGLWFPTPDGLAEHHSTCDHARVEDWERTLQAMTSPGSECFPCCRLLSLDDVLYNGQMLIYRTYEESVCCSSCRDAWFPYEGKAMMQRQDVDKYLYLRRTTVPYPWLKQYRAQLFKELQEFLHHPMRVQKWLDTGRELEAYLE
ncbi:hypothetical protein PC129_g629 [Phytophthora cactorum]|uniref:Uncharacterized protein n=3 Tax=Phytophthora cactorum TaxID=29920 RepID=A0A8T1EFG5_9STRA|nr:hypothetical protein PC112_g2444 [Phytophthora cactorum]KAG2932441.1 hypothetical protein PC114_g1862 [Phytophthora cactorum]KAG2953637.1 hypothetical protein PC117_g1856 [Phytophthora cactorum]KAG3034499.1 hypothetical protein PC120_g1390 [Phytophthora cactorum]KAG3189567.1 hypothetical protein C6341_g2178 [Phytophthora cactorum]